MTAPVHGITPRDVPQVRLDILDWLASPTTRTILEQRAPTPGVTQFLAANAASAELYYVNSDMTHLAHTVGRDLGVYALTPDDLPARSGLLVWETPLDDGGAHWAPSAVMWLANETRFSVSMFVSATHYLHWAKAWGPSAVTDARPIRAGRLILRGQAQPLPVDGRERPWETMNLAANDVVLRTLLATWLLIRQPASARTLHHVEHVPAPKSVQHRLRGRAPDPAAAIRLVTLRRALRPAAGAAADREHAAQVYRHRWVVRLHRRTYPDHTSPSGFDKKWIGPYLAVPKGCESAPIIGADRVNVLRR
ncbi:hypothetical protein [Kitasatospora sp. NPDC088783]|uniref:hypothetical protein n=1 Tax=Kitasatospora sp. NPDC088783 TaxID=3364077 RepID=UPI00383099C5